MPDARFFTNHGPFTLAEIVAGISGGGIPIALATAEEGARVVDDVATLDNGSRGQLSFFDNRKYRDAYRATEAEACIVREAEVANAPEGLVLLVTERPYEAYALAAATFYPESLMPYVPVTHGIADDAELDATVKVEPSSIVASGVRIGAHTIIGPHCVIGPGVHIGDDCVISAGCVVTHATLGNRVVLYPGAKIGQDGFGYAPGPSGIIKVPQLGGVEIGDNVEIGANTTIDRGTSGNTIIGAHTKIDNLVQVGHNVEIGAYCFIVAHAGLAGSAKIGNGVMLGGQCGIGGHITLGDRVQVAAQSGVIHDIADGTKVGGSPAYPARLWHRQTVAIRKLAEGK